MSDNHNDSDSESQCSTSSSLHLSSSTLALLNQFKLEESQAQQNLLLLKEKQQQQNPDEHCDMSVFAEDWQLSQFWYSEETARELACEVLRSSGSSDRIGFLSSPTAFVAFQNLMLDLSMEKAASGGHKDQDGPSARPGAGEDDQEDNQRQSFVFEFDERFNVFGSKFVFYDYRDPVTRLSHLQNKFDFLIIDPPFLAEECWYKTSETAKYLLRPDGKGKIIVCTGMVMQEQIKRELGCNSTIFKPAHAKDRLSNEFGSFINYTSTSPNWILEKDDDDADDDYENAQDMKTRRED